MDYEEKNQLISRSISFSIYPTLKKQMIYGWFPYHILKLHFLFEDTPLHLLQLSRLEFFLLLLVLGF